MSITETYKETYSTDDPLSPSAEAASTITNRDNNEGDQDVQDLLHELEEQELDETQKAVHKLKESTDKLTHAIKSVSSDIDSKFKITDQAKHLDSQFKLSDQAKSVDAKLDLRSKVSAVTSWITTSSQQVNEQVHKVMNREDVQKVSHDVVDFVDKNATCTGIKDAVVNASREVKHYEEEHHVTAKAVGVVSSGIDWVTNTLSSVSSGGK